MRVRNKHYRRLRLETLEGRLLLAGNTSPASSLEFGEEQAIFGPLTVDDFDLVARNFLLDAGESLRSGDLDHPGEVHEFQFRATEAGGLTIKGSAMEGSNLDCSLSLYGPDEDGQLVVLMVASDDRSQGDKDAFIDQHLALGVYRLEVTASPWAGPTSSVGEYTLTTNWQPASPSLEPIPVEGQPWAIASADFNGDEIADLATANAWSSDVSILIGLGDGTFCPPTRYPVGSSPGSIVAGDFNGDGSKDLAVGNAGSDDVSVLLGNGDGTFQSAPEPFKVGDEPAVMAVADLDGDGRDDLVVPAKAGGDVRVFLGSSDPNHALVHHQHIVPQVLREEVGLEPAEEGENPYVKGSFRSVALAHLNDDDRLDLVVTFKKYDCVVVWLGTEDATFRRGQVVLVGDNLPQEIGVDDGTHCVALADYNGDGRLDLAAVNDTSDTVSVRFGNGDGTFHEDGEEYEAGDDAEFLFTAQLNDDNGDGVVDDRDYPDVATGNEDSRDLTILLSRGPPPTDTDRPVFYEPTSVPVHCLPDEVAAGDFNGDFRTDLAVASRDGKVLILLGLGDGTFQHDGRFGVGDDPEALAYADFNGDGLIDVVTANGRSDDVSVLLGRGDGTFQPQRRFPLQADINHNGVFDPGEAGQMPHAIVAYDFNRDGRLDLATANESSDNISILLGLGNGDFSLVRQVSVGESPWSLVVADLDEDGVADLATANRLTNSVSILYGNGDGTFQPHTQLTVGEFPELIVAKDFDHDGWLDLGTVNRLSHDVSILSGSKGRQFSHRRANTFPVEDFDYSPVLGWELGSRDDKEVDHTDDIRFFPRGVVSGDFNNDGFFDVAAADDRANEVSVFLGYGDGTYQPALRLPCGDDPEWISTGHFNDDNHDGFYDDRDYLDLVLSLDHSAAVSILLGTGNGAFAEGPTYPLTSGSERVLVGDFNGDRKYDLACQMGRKLTILLGNGNGSFQTPTVYLTGTASEAMAIGHFDRDDHLDVAHIDGKQDPATLVVCRGKGDGSFENPPDDDPLIQQLAERYKGATFKSLDAADLDGDGNLDLVAADLTWHRLFVFWGRGDGTFEVQDLLLGDYPISSPWDASVRPVVTDDFNDDGRLDLATVNEFDGEISVVLNLGEREFQTDEENQTYKVGVGPGALASADINRDGYPDLIVGNRHSFDVSILLGNGDGTFQPQRLIAGGQEPAPSVRADFNGDHPNGTDHLDLAWVDDNLNYVSVLLNVGADEDRFVDSRLIHAGIRSVPILADLDGDGTTDSLQVDLQGNILVRRGTADGFKPPLEDEDNASSPARDVALVITGEDAVPLVAAVNQQADDDGNWISLYRFQGEGLEYYASFDGLGLPTSLVSGDLDGDGDDDLVVTDAATSAVVVFLQSDGVFSWQCSVDMGNTPSAVALLDAGSPGGGRDGCLDMVVVDGTSGEVSIVLNDGTGNFGDAPPVRLRASNGLYGLDESFAVRSAAQTTGIASGDFNEDDVPDLVLTNSGLNTFSILLGKSSGGFVDPRSILCGSTPTEVRAADFDGDEQWDLAILNKGSATISIFLGNGDGSFQEPAFSVDAGDSPTGFTVDDLNGNEILDLVVGSESGDLLRLLGDGEGTFAPPPLTPEERGQHVALAVADVDGDGVDDLITASALHDQIRVQRGNRQTDFPDIPSDELLAPGAVEIADLNKDGHSDILVANSGANNVLVYLGDGSGEFARAVSYPAGTKPVSLTIGDLSGDGHLDLAVANECSNDVSILLGNGDGTLQPGVRLVAGAAPVATEIGDFDRDGIVDLLVANSGEDTVYLLKGLGFGFFDDQNLTAFETGGKPTELIVGQFDAKPGLDLLTLNALSNNLTFYSGFTRLAREKTLAGLDPRMAPQASAKQMSYFAVTIRTGGQTPVDAVVARADFDGYDDLFVAHQDGKISLLFGSADGPQAPIVVAELDRGLAQLELVPSESDVWRYSYTFAAAWQETGETEYWTYKALPPEDDPAGGIWGVGVDRLLDEWKLSHDRNVRQVDTATEDVSSAAAPGDREAIEAIWDFLTDRPDTNDTSASLDVQKKTSADGEGPAPDPGKKGQDTEPEQEEKGKQGGQFTSTTKGGDPVEGPSHPPIDPPDPPPDDSPEEATANQEVDSFIAMLDGIWANVRTTMGAVIRELKRHPIIWGLAGTPALAAALGGAVWVRHARRVKDDKTPSPPRRPMGHREQPEHATSTKQWISHEQNPLRPSRRRVEV